MKGSSHLVFAFDWVRICDMWTSSHTSHAWLVTSLNTTTVDDLVPHYLERETCFPRARAEKKLSSKRKERVIRRTSWLGYISRVGGNDTRKWSVLYIWSSMRRMGSPFPLSRKSAMRSCTSRDHIAGRSKVIHDHAGERTILLKTHWKEVPCRRERNDSHEISRAGTGEGAWYKYHCT